LGRLSEQEKVMNEKMTALAAYRAGKLSLPPGYHLEADADSLTLQRDDGSMVATFAPGAAPAEVARAAEEDYREHGQNSA
jgi:hypothetical protein